MRNGHAPHLNGRGQGVREHNLRLADIIPHLQKIQRRPDGSYTACCPCHDDTNPSLSLKEQPDGTVLVHCFAGCPQDTVWRELCRIAGVQPARANLILPRQRQQTRNAGETVSPAHLTLEQYARAKGLDANLLREWGLTDTERGITIPYLDTDGNRVATRYRLALDGENRFTWERGNRPCLYGLWRLREWSDTETLYLCEGETDTLTFWSAGLPALGILAPACGEPNGGST